MLCFIHHGLEVGGSYRERALGVGEVRVERIICMGGVGAMFLHIVVVNGSVSLLLQIAKTRFQIRK